MLVRLFFSLYNIHRSAAALRCCNEFHLLTLPLITAVENEKNKMRDF